MILYFLIVSLLYCDEGIKCIGKLKNSEITFIFTHDRCRIDYNNISIRCIYQKSTFIFVDHLNENMVELKINSIYTIFLLLRIFYAIDKFPDIFNTEYAKNFLKQGNGNYKNFKTNIFSNTNYFVEIINYDLLQLINSSKIKNIISRVDIALLNYYFNNSDLTILFNCYSLFRDGLIVSITKKNEKIYYIDSIQSCTINEENEKYHSITEKEFFNNIIYNLL